ncbi:hypothetical protein [Hymenobacter fodinae]|uniref:Uncharacterized protein n=1 Tax=Hymenobacter fodinae TaxID=2510796 RepID=A0A4Z0P7A6_9BACT|nr:hypothetical protein [Hymenobacter fodinae]TGE08304.1 hypothetical protein EU556_11330 [Hymenobacter fodinae]
MLMLQDQVSRPKQSILQMTFPLPPSKFQPSDKWSYMPQPAEIRRLRQWQTVWLTGNNRADSLNLRLLWRKLGHMQQFPNNTTGVAVRFGAGARFGRVVDVVDCVSQWNVKKYVFDIHAPTPVLYAFTDAQQAPVSGSAPNHDALYSAAPAAPDSASSASSRWLQQIGAPLRHPAWSTALLACLGLAAVGAAVYFLRELS